MKAGRATEGAPLTRSYSAGRVGDLLSICLGSVDIVAGTFHFVAVGIVRAIIVNASAGKKPRTAV